MRRNPSGSQSGRDFRTAARYAARTASSSAVSSKPNTVNGFMASPQLRKQVLKHITHRSTPGRFHLTPPRLTGAGETRRRSAPAFGVNGPLDFLLRHG